MKHKKHKLKSDDFVICWEHCDKGYDQQGGVPVGIQVEISIKIKRKNIFVRLLNKVFKKQKELK